MINRNLIPKTEITDGSPAINPSDVMQVLTDFSNGVKPRLTAMAELGLNDFGVLLRMLNDAGIPHPIVSVEKREAMAAEMVKIFKDRQAPAEPQTSEPFRIKYRLLCWSNTAAPDCIYIRKALLKTRPDILLDACLEFGLDEVHRQWEILLLEGESETLRSIARTDLILGIIEAEFEQSKIEQ
jgi:hypothetical protein